MHMFTQTPDIYIYIYTYWAPFVSRSCVSSPAVLRPHLRATRPVRTNNTND